MNERLEALTECSEICRELIRKYKFEDDVAFGVRIVLDRIEALIRSTEPDGPSEGC
jgi:hypothetical protein